MSFLNENVANNKSPTDAYQAGITNVDQGTQPEIGSVLPWVIDPQFTFLDYQCFIMCQLDSGIVTHRILPQKSSAFDTLGGGDVTKDAFKTLKTGVNLVSQGEWTDLVQRMSHSVYRFGLFGFAQRVGYQITIPGLISVAGVPAIPDDEKPQTAFNILWGNLSGIPVYVAKWELWYTVSVPPTAAQDPPANLAERIAATDAVPFSGIQVPVSYPNQDALPSAPPSAPLNLNNPLRGS